MVLGSRVVFTFQPYLFMAIPFNVNINNKKEYDK